MIKVLGIMVLFFVVFLIVRKLQAPRAGTERLVITVWSAFGPYNSAEDAEIGLNRACSAVFGSEGIAEHKEWIQGHVNNFHEWQAEQRFQKAQKLMRSGLSLTSYGPAFNRACQTVKMAALEEAQESLNGLSKDFPEIHDVAQRTIDHHREEHETPLRNKENKKGSSPLLTHFGFLDIK